MEGCDEDRKGVARKILEVHSKHQAMIEQGYYSDAPDRAYYRDIGGKYIKRYLCKRGTSGLEAAHYHWHRFLDSFSTDASLVNVLFHWFVAVWNQRALIKNCGYNNYGMYDMALLEEIEAVTVIDVLRRAGAEVVVMSVEDDRNEVVCSRGVRLVADKNVKELAGRGAPADWDLIAVPGGMPGAEHIADHVKFHAVLEKHFRAGKLMAAICAAPAICFEPKGFLEGYAATAHPAFVDELGGSLLEKNIYQDCRVVVDTQIVTSRGPGTSMEWALCLVEQLYGSRKAREVAAPMVVQPANARLRRNLEWRLDETPAK